MQSTTLVLLGVLLSFAFPVAARHGWPAAFWRLYGPLRGGIVLGLTWLFALGGLAAGLSLDAAAPLVRSLLAVGLPVLAVTASYIHRDLRRDARGMPPVTHTVPAGLDAIDRAGCALAAAASAAGAAWQLFWAESPGWFVALGLSVLAYGFGQAALRGRFAHFFLAAFELREGEPGGSAAQPADAGDDPAPFTVLLAAVLPAAYGIYHAVRYRSRSSWAMCLSYGLLGAGMLWAFMRM